jgi:hypothetical protein
MSKDRRTLTAGALAASAVTSRPGAVINGGPSDADGVSNRSGLFAGARRASMGVKAALTGPRTAYRAAGPGTSPLSSPGSLAEILAGMNPVSEPADAELVAASVVLGRCASADPRLRAVWMHYAYRAARQLWGDANPATLRISRAYQRLATELGHLLPAVLTAEHRLRVYQRLGATEQEMTTGLELAALLSQTGLCEFALDRITGTWTTWQASRRDPATGLRILLDRAVMLAGCGRSSDAITILDQHAGLLRDAEAELIELTVQRLNAAEIFHRAVCRQPARTEPPNSGDNRLEFWTLLLRQATAGEPSTVRRPSRQDHNQVPPASGVTA